MNKIESKKLSMADKMYKQVGAGGKNASPKFKMIGKNTGKKGGEGYPMTGKGTTQGGGEKYPQSNVKGSVVGKYNQSNKAGSISGKYNQ